MLRVLLAVAVGLCGLGCNPFNKTIREVRSPIRPTGTLVAADLR